MNHGGMAMTKIQVKDPFQLLFELILKGNTRTLVIRDGHRTIMSFPFGFAVAGFVALSFTVTPVVIFALVLMYLTGCSFAVEGPAPITFRLVYAPSAQSDASRGANVAEPVSVRHAPASSSTPVEMATVGHGTPS